MEILQNDLSRFFQQSFAIHQAAMDWTLWRPRERANLCFIRKDDRLLLIRKIEPGETALAAAIRETWEEVGVVPLGAEPRGELHFQFANGYSLHCTVFFATDLRGEPVDTAEAAPFWADIKALPYDEMWEDDRYWLPLLLEGKSFTGFFTFDGEAMLTKTIEIRSQGMPG
jgi:8-oxo-dGTP diphosphatase